MCVLALLMANWSAELVNYGLLIACEWVELCAHTHKHAYVRSEAAGVCLIKYFFNFFLANRFLH